MLIPTQHVPPLDVGTVSHDKFNVQAEARENFVLILFYRGLHCPYCVKQLTELAALDVDFQQLGVRHVAISMDTLDRAEKMAAKFGNSVLRIGFGMHEATARQWGLFLSASGAAPAAAIQPPPVFNEPGIFLVGPQAQLYFSSVQSMPAARPHLGELLSTTKALITGEKAPRGAYTRTVGLES